MPGQFIICVISPMKADSKDCVHKIVYFQSHRTCNQIASICNCQCQPVHTSKEPHVKYSLQKVQDKFNSTKSIIIDEIQKFSDALRKPFEDLINKVKKKQDQFLKQMQQQLVKALVEDMKIDRLVFDKIENSRLQKIKCVEIYRLLDKTNIQKNIDRVKLQAVYEKYESIISNFFQAFEPKKENNPAITQTPITIRNTANNHLGPNELKTRNDILQDQNQQLRIQIEEIKLKCSQFEVQKTDLQWKLIKKRIEDASKRRVNTWNIARVETKKIKKNKLPLVNSAIQNSNKLNGKKQTQKLLKNQQQAEPEQSQIIHVPDVLSQEVVFEEIKFFPNNLAPALNPIQIVETGIMDIKNKDLQDQNMDLITYMESKNRI